MNRRISAALPSCLVSLTLAANACVRTHACRPSTLLITVNLDSATSADTLRLGFALGNDASGWHALQRKDHASLETVEIDFPSGYSASQSANVEVDALVMGEVVATAAHRFSLAPSCTTLSLSLQPVALPVTLKAIHPAVASAGATVSLEGRFDTKVDVHFPGSASAVAATVLGSARATVTVPADATAGPLTVTSGGMTTSPVYFRRPSFALDLQNFNPQYEQADYARQMPSLNAARGGHTVSQLGNWVYVVGGRAEAALGSIERAMVNGDGTLGAFISDAKNPTLLEPRFGHAAVVVGNSLYVIGGADDGKIERASVEANGLLGPFTDAGVSLATPRRHASAIVIGHYVYIIGGADAHGAPLKSIERALIQDDGTLAPFVDAGVTLKTPSSAHTAAVIGNYVYVFGGYSDTTPYLDRVERAEISGNAALEPFDDASLPRLTMARGAHQTLVLGNKVLIVGGDAGTPLTSIEAATIDNGSLGPFASEMATLTIGRSDAASLLVANFVYVLGGNQPTASVERASINGSGALDPFTTASVKLPTPLPSLPQPAPNVLYPETHWVVPVGNNVYVGDESFAGHAPINADGTLGSFVVDANVTGWGMPVVMGNYLYLIGPQSQRAAINDDGTLGAWLPIQVTGLTVQGGFRLVAVGNSIVCVAGGINAGPSATVQRAIPALDGTLVFTSIGASALNDTRQRGGVVLLGKRLFVFSGYDANGATPKTEVAPLTGTDFSLGPFTTTVGHGEQFDQTAVVVGPTVYELTNGYSVVQTATAAFVNSCSVNDPTLNLQTAALASPIGNGLQMAAALTTMSNVYVFGGYVKTGTAPGVATDTIEQAALR
jgi:N-acetylneuraminic acid mutarotase